MAAKKRQNVDNAAAQRLNVRVDIEAYRRLLLHSIMGKEQPGAIVSRLIDSGLKTWALPANLTARAEKSNRVDISASESESENKAA